jgi:hypothetical protein
VPVKAAVGHVVVHQQQHAVLVAPACKLTIRVNFNLFVNRIFFRRMRNEFENYCTIYSAQFHPVVQVRDEFRAHHFVQHTFSTNYNYLKYAFLSLNQVLVTIK